MKKIDIILSLITGEWVAFYFVWLIKNLQNINLLFLYWLLPILFPILAVIGIWTFDLIGKKYLSLYQLAKFFLIGAFFAVFDLTILNILMKYFGISENKKIKYIIFVLISFIIATSIKYIADKYWAFEKTEKEQIESEFIKFFIVTIISGGIQVGIASSVFSILSFTSGINKIIIGNIGKISGILVASAWNFLGYKFLVFKK